MSALGIPGPGGIVAEAGAGGFFASLGTEIRRPTVWPVLELLSDVEGAASNNLSTLRSVLIAFYRRNHRLDADGRRRLTREGQIRWAETGLAIHQRSAAILALEMDSRLPLHSDTVNELLDLGCGDGRMTRAVIRALLDRGAPISTVVLVDNNELALKLAVDRLDEAGGLDKIVAEPRDIRWLVSTAVPRKGRVAVASACLHEIPPHERGILLHRLAKLVDCLLLVELSQDNSVKSQSFEFLLGVAKFYDAIMRDAMATLLPPYAWPTVGVFLLDEFLQILTSDYARRGNFHLRSDQWESVLFDAGFRVDVRSVSQFEGLTSFCAIARPRDRAAHDPGNGIRRCSASPRTSGRRL